MILAVWNPVKSHGNRTSVFTMLDSLGIQEALGKACPPSPRMEFLGNIVDAQKMTLEVSPQRLAEITEELEKWLIKDTVKRKQLESLIGKLSFVSNCVRAGRVFIARLINELFGFPQHRKKKLSIEIEEGHSLVEMVFAKLQWSFHTVVN